MSTKIYYRAGKPDKDVDPTGGKVGHIQAIEEYIAKDETRVAFEKQLTEDESFRKMIGFTKHPVEEYLHEWKERAKTGGQFVQPADHVNEKVSYISTHTHIHTYTHTYTHTHRAYTTD